MCREFETLEPILGVARKLCFQLFMRHLWELFVSEVFWQLSHFTVVSRRLHSEPRQPSPHPSLVAAWRPRRGYRVPPVTGTIHSPMGFGPPQSKQLVVFRVHGLVRSKCA